MIVHTQLCPLHVAELHDGTLRFFAPPDGEPAFPWCELEGVRQAAGVRQPPIEFALAVRTKYPQACRVLGSDAGPVTFVSLALGQAVFAAAQREGLRTEQDERLFLEEASFALWTLLERLPEHERAPYFIAADAAYWAEVGRAE